MKRSGFAKKEGTPKWSSFTPKLESTKDKPRKKMKSKGMPGNPPTVLQKAFHDELAELGCIACRIFGRNNPKVSIHHIDGRTKPDAHWLVLPLCAGHHQDGTGDDKTMIAVHPWKKRFEERYGTQLELLELCRQLIN